MHILPVTPRMKAWSGFGCGYFRDQQSEVVWCRKKFWVNFETRWQDYQGSVSIKISYSKYRNPYASVYLAAPWILFCDRFNHITNLSNCRTKFLLSQTWLKLLCSTRLCYIGIIIYNDINLHDRISNMPWIRNHERFIISILQDIVKCTTTKSSIEDLLT